MKVVLTVVGKDRVGIISDVSKALTEFDINILDVSQTIMEDFFTMMMMLDFKSTILSFNEIKESLSSLSSLGKKLQIKINLQRDEIFDTMHKL